MAQIALTRGLVTLVDDADFEYINQWKWCAIKVSAGRFYAARAKGVMVHRLLTNASEFPGLVVDHINRDSLDNRRCNLRLVTPKQNQQNSGMYRSNTSGFKGVRLEGGRWTSQIWVGGRNRYLGRFDTREAASAAFRDAVRTHRGDFGIAALEAL